MDDASRDIEVLHDERGSRLVAHQPGLVRRRGESDLAQGESIPLELGFDLEIAGHEATVQVAISLLHGWTMSYAAGMTWGPMIGDRRMPVRIGSR